MSIHGDSNGNSSAGRAELFYINHYIVLSFRGLPLPPLSQGMKDGFIAQFWITLEDVNPHLALVINR